MDCKRIERWLSDYLDGELSRKKQKNVEAHLQKCPFCRSYKQRLETIQERAKTFSTPDIAPEYWQESLTRLKAKIDAAEADGFRHKTIRPSLLSTGWKWAWAGAGALFIAMLGLFLMLSRERSPQEMYALSFEETVERVYGEIGNNPELENQLNSVIAASINESVEGVYERISPMDYNSPLFWEGLTEEELKFIESEIRKEIGS
ncbi:MAG: zf-HC2 domain-containing protein [Candidatus Aminicenantales bacterium]